MEELATKSLCYNKGCGVEFDPDKNHENSCVFHNGEPYFHDAYKGWSCCKKKSVDFGEFLNIKGCCVGKHNSVRPEKLNKLKPKEEREKLSKKFEDLMKPTPRMERPPPDTPYILLSSKVMKALEEQFNSRDTFVQPLDIDDGNVADGTACCNTSCTVVYERGKILPECVYHPGTAVFHEGLKYWSCCRKKNMEFSEFMNQAGCTKGQHVWVKPATIRWRMDWYQRETRVVISLFAQDYDPYASTIHASPVALKIRLVFYKLGQEKTEDVYLYGVIDTQGSNVVMYPSKVEITLAKKEIISWPQLSP